MLRFNRNELKIQYILVLTQARIEVYFGQAWAKRVTEWKEMPRDWESERLRNVHSIVYVCEPMMTA